MTQPRPGLLVCALLSASLAACGDPKPHSARAPAEHALPTLHLRTESLPRDNQTVGSVASNERVEINSRLYYCIVNTRPGWLQEGGRGPVPS